MLRRHLEKQSEVLMEAYRAMSHELHRLQVDLKLVLETEILKIKRERYFWDMFGINCFFHFCFPKLLFHVNEDT